MSAFLTGLFFVVFGVTFGVYFASLIYKKNRWLSIGIPTIIEILTTTAMYVGELLLMGGELYCFGSSMFFQSMGDFVFSLCDITIIVLSGVFTFIISYLLNWQTKK